ncbi:MAG: hypothetical protein ACYTG0_23185 [Planctomycetota bacterium]|jgi:hypothetical protein
MKPLIILLVGCLPLFVLTVWAFVGLGSADASLEVARSASGVAPSEGSLEDVAAQVQREKPLVEALAEVDLFSGATIEGLGTVPEESSFQPFKEDWAKWAEARRMVAAFLAIERDLPAASPDELRSIDPARLEDAKEQWTGFQEQFKASPVEGRKTLLKLASTRIAHLDEAITRHARVAEANKLLEQASAAFSEGRYGDSVSLSDELIGTYRDVLAPDVASKVEILRQRAQFWGDAQGAYAGFDEGKTLEDRKKLLEGFLGKYNDRGSRTAAELKTLDDYQRHLAEITRRIRQREDDRLGWEAVAALGKNPPADFNEGLNKAAAIHRAYPTVTVKAAAASLVKGLLEAHLPQVEIDESPSLQEAELVRGGLLRGFFKEVRGADGTPYGYKRYPTYEQLLKPTSDVGTQPKEHLVAAPGRSLPSRFAAQYNDLRSRLLGDPSRREAWEELAASCEQMNGELLVYRKKPVVGPEPPVISFEAQSRFVREFLSKASWADLEVLFGP